MKGLIDFLRQIELFEGLDDDSLRLVAGICKPRSLQKDEVLAEEGSRGDALYLVTRGFVAVVVAATNTRPERILVNLGVGQLIGEMSLVDQGARSATLRAVVTPTEIQEINYRAFQRLCEQNTHLGYYVMRNLAADLSFKIRHQNERGK